MNKETHNDLALRKWKNQLNRKDFTAYLMIGIGQGKSQGELLLLTTEEQSGKNVLAVLEVIKKEVQCKIDATNKKA